MKTQTNNRIFKTSIIFALLAASIFVSQCGDDPASSTHECGSGDVNLNEHSYEIADAVVFTNYLVYGYPAFTVDSAQQTQATDVNCNGIPCELGDLVHIIRILTGDDLDRTRAFSRDTANFRYQHGQLIVDEKLGAALFIFDGIVNVSPANSGFEVKNDYVNGQTHVLVYTFETKEITGAILNASETPDSIVAVDYYGTSYNIERHWPIATFSISPNPFHTTTNFIITLSEQSHYVIRIYTIDGDLVDLISGDGEGTITREWNIGDRPSGIYYISFEAGGTSVVGKMIALPEE